MRKKIFRNCLLVGVLVLVLCCTLFVGIFYWHSENQTFDRLSAEVDYIAHGLELSGETYLDTLDTPDRVSWIASDGEVLYDSEADAAEMENHLDREEVEEALTAGEGRSVRYSETLLERDLYYAQTLDDGTVLRISCTQSSVVAMLLELVGPLVAIFVVALILCIILSFRLAHQIVGSINKIDLENPRLDEGYSELKPLEQRIREQNRTIQAQMDELGRQQRDFEALTENMGEGFLLLDNKARVLASNPSARRLLYPGAELKDLRRDVDFQPLLDVVEEALGGSHAETVRDYQGGSWQIVADPVYADGRVAGVAVLLTDVTEREQRERLRREFSANVSHELKTPLTSISGFAELLASGLVAPDKTEEFAGDIQRESKRLIELVDDILRLSKLDEDDGLFEKEAVDLYDLADEIVGTLRPIAEMQDIDITLSGEHVSVMGTRQILHDMIYNLCDNAIKYNRPEGSVAVSVGMEEGHARLTVSDTGIGIPQADQARVFERFYRVDKSRSKEVGGTGLGLSIVKHGAQYHHATIALESTPGDGTTVTVTF